MPFGSRGSEVHTSCVRDLEALVEVHTPRLNPRRRCADSGTIHFWRHICCFCGGCSVRCRMFSSIYSLCPLGARPSHTHVPTNIVPRHRPMSPAGQDCPWVSTTALDLGNQRPRGEGAGFCLLNKRSHPPSEAPAHSSLGTSAKTSLFLENQTHPTLSQKSQLRLGWNIL